MNTSRDMATFSAAPTLQRLYGFQRDAVHHAFERLFLAEDSTRRFLIADEVGLGKTMIARGVLAMAVEHLRTRVDRLDIIYICSNLSIAKQNINRLNPFPNREFPEAQRITLLPLHMQQMQGSDINLVAFTPGTSLDLANSLGTRTERQLLHTLLERIWPLSGVAPMNLLQGSVRDADSFREQLRVFRDEHAKQLDAASHVIDAFAAELTALPDIRGRFEALCERFARKRAAVPDDDRRDRNTLVGDLRGALARACIGVLEPDLIILDEFQRFRNLLDPNDESAQLAQQLFEWSSEHARAHVMLLSATPYKPYTLQHEATEDDHYKDFLRTLDFLHHRGTGMTELEAAIRDYRRELLAAPSDLAARLAPLKAEIETRLRRVMSRTERLASSADDSGMLRSLCTTLDVQRGDLESYVASRTISDAVDIDEPVEYWKSAPYALTFMEGYRLREMIRERVDGQYDCERLSGALESAGNIPNLHTAMERCEALNPPNPKLRQLMFDMDVKGAFDVLWLPPSMPSYRLDDRFEAAARAGLTKRLVFSAWNLVPRSIASLLSYEAERRRIAQGSASASREAGLGRDQVALLRFAMDGTRPVGMPALALIYPSLSLVRLGDPRELARLKGAQADSLADVLDWVKERIRPFLEQIVPSRREGDEDEAWYWAAPVLLDLLIDRSATVAWWENENLAAAWQQTTSDGEGSDDDSGSASWQAHVEHARRLALGDWLPEGAPPSDLLEVLAALAVGGPGTCALRALLRLFPDVEAMADLRLAAARMGWSLRGLLNRPQSIAMVRAAGIGIPYWRQAVDYCAAGCLGSVLEEYFHVLRDAVGVGSHPAEKACVAMAEEAAEAIGVRAGTLTLEELVLDARTRRPRHLPFKAGTLFAMRFGGDKQEDVKQANRDKVTRAAFNSPFWPFVLATTSVGQEGLDFHWYCHAVTHWNLPSNPVDLEQREGRVHRFKGHAIRKNVAKRFGTLALLSDATDPWTEAFRLAKQDCPPDDRGLMPYWLYPVADGACVERHVPLYPLSRDEIRYDALRKALGAYRLVFGQPRQDELLAYLLDRVDAHRLSEMAHLLRIDLSPPRCGD
jgi:hypothetical protein